MVYKIRLTIRIGKLFWLESKKLINAHKGEVYEVNLW